MRLSDDDIQKISTLGLAHLGDAVFELMVRAWLCENGGATSKGLHRAAVCYVSAPAQAEAAARILPRLTDDERAIYMRGRNAKVNSVPSHASLVQYHAATGLEALFGYIYLRGELDRLNVLFDIIMEEQNAS
ncbi:MAG: ribonuclease III [Oscillospiraceae bacterium]|nr:ribonuclease III [Oscillospiraceae bacterium]